MNVINLKECSDINQYDLVVAGAGITGTSLAYIAAHEYALKVLVVEKSGQVGGLLSNSPDGTAAYGCHFLHTDDQQIVTFLKGIDKWKKYQPKAAVSVRDEDICLPINDDGIEQLMGDSLGMLIKDRISEETSREESFDSPSIWYPDLLSSQDPYVRKLAKKMDTEIRKPIMRLFQVEKATQIPDMFAVDNIRLLTADTCYRENSQLYPSQGYTALIQRMLTQPSIDVCLHTDFNEYFSVNELNGCIVCGTVKLEIPVVYTGRLDNLYQKRYGSLPYLSLKKVEQAEGEAAETYFDYAIRDGALFCCTRYPSQDTEQTTEACFYQIHDKPLEDAVDFLPQKEASDIVYQEYCKGIANIQNFYICGHLAEYRKMNMAECVRSAMETFSRIRFTHPISLLPSAVTYRRPMEQLLDPGNCFEKNYPFPSELIVGDLNRPLPEITVIIPTYKRKDSLRRTLRSVLNQTVDPECYEILVVDNDPEDTEELEKFFKEARIPNLLYYRNSKNLGAYGNMNRCFELARTKWVSMVHDDDMLFMNALKWAMESITFLKDPKLGAVIPRQIIAGDVKDFEQRLFEKGQNIRRSSMRLKSYPGKIKWKLDGKLHDISKRRYWRISRTDCYFVPFLYPAPSYGTLINREAMLEIGGFGEGYPLDDNFCFNRLAEKYHVYLCGEAWGLYSFETADVIKPRVSIQFMDSVEQYRRYMQAHSKLCGIAGKFYSIPSYIYSVDDNFNDIKRRYGYCTDKSNYPNYEQYCATAREIVWSKRIRKTWDFMIKARACACGKKVTRDLISRAGGEHL